MPALHEPEAPGVVHPPKSPPLTPARLRQSQQDPLWVRLTLIALAIGLLTVLVIVPVVFVFVQALADGFEPIVELLTEDEDTVQSIITTLIVAPVSVLLNTLFGMMAAWLIARFQFRGRTLLISLIDLPFSVSPAVAGVLFVLLFGLQGYFGPWLQAHNVKILYAIPGLILATSFVTFPFVARELIPVLQAVGPEEELAALSLGANGRQTFWRITLPNIKWGLLYGVILCNARAMGEFGAVYVVAGRSSGTETIPLHVGKLFQQFNTPGSFALASLLMMLALVTLVLKAIVERRAHAKKDEAKS